jgi:hypothetical protein
MREAERAAGKSSGVRRRQELAQAGAIYPHRVEGPGTRLRPSAKVDQLVSSEPPVDLVDLERHADRATLGFSDHVPEPSAAAS